MTNPNKRPNFIKLRHKNGPATRVPQSLDQLASADTKSSELACGNLLDAFQHDGQWFSASAPALEAALDRVESASRPELVLGLVADILASDHVLAWPRPALADPEQTDAHGNATRATVLAQSERLLSWSTSEAPGLRMGAAQVLAFMPEIAARSVPTLLTQFEQEQDPRVVASLILALARLGEVLADSNPSAARRAAEVVQGGLVAPWPVVRGAAAVAGFRADLPLASMQAQLGEWIEHSESLSWFWGTCESFGQRLGIAPAATGSLVAVARHQRRPEVLTDALVELGAQRDPGRLTRRIGDMLLKLGDWRFTFVATPPELSPLQTYIARQVAPTHLLPVGGAGLPASGSARKRWISIDDPGPLDTNIGVEIEGVLRSWPKWRAWWELRQRGMAGPAELPTLIAQGMSPLERWQSVVELAAETFISSIGPRPLEVDEELARVPHDSQFFASAAQLADEFSARLRAATAEGRRGIPPLPLTLLLLLPFARAGRPIALEWDPIIALQPEAEPVLRALHAERLEALAIERIPLSGGSTAALGVSQVLNVIHLFPSRAVVLHIIQALAELKRSSFPGAARYDAQLQAAAQKDARLESIIQTLER